MKNSLFLAIASIALISSSFVEAGVYKSGATKHSNHRISARVLPSNHRSKPIRGISFGYDLTATPEDVWDGYDDGATLWDEFGEDGNIGLDVVEYDGISDGFLIPPAWSFNRYDPSRRAPYDPLAPIRSVRPVHPPNFHNAPIVIPVPQRHGVPPRYATKVESVNMKGTPSKVEVNRPVLRVATPAHPYKKPWMSFTTDSERYRIVNEDSYGSKKKLIGPMGRVKRPIPGRVGTYNTKPKADYDD
ncbi:hypothetical protein K7432_004193 [Basidiobolus ranarum]|uniref:Uncharacterized protein n=1 Tax=Basidiobolus ranarum TaxID=34480 RepID=A0ABR2W4Z8_9FUNG